MKKKYVIFIIIGLLMLSYFSYKGFYFFKYVVSVNNSEDVNDYLNGLKIKDTIKIENRLLNDDEYIKFKNIKIRNDFNDFEVNDNTFGKTYVKEDNELGDVRFSTLSVPFNFYEAVREVVTQDEKWFDKFLKKKNINNDLDLILYAINNKGKKPSIFSSVKEMKFYYYVYNLTLLTYPKFNDITLISGDLYGFIIDAIDMPIKEVFIMDGFNKYVIDFWNREYFTDEYISDLLSTVILENDYKIGISEKTDCHNDVERYYQSGNQKIYLSCLNDVKLLDNYNISLRDYLKKGNSINSVINEFISKMNFMYSYDDGGTSIYKNNNMTIVKCNTISQNNDVYIGNSELDVKEGMKNGFCKDDLNFENSKLIEKNATITEVLNDRFTVLFDDEHYYLIINNKQIYDISDKLLKDTRVKVKFYDIVMYSDPAQVNYVEDLEIIE